MRDGVDHLGGGVHNPLNPRGDLGYMGFNTFHGDNWTYAIILLVPNEDRELRLLRDEGAWMKACRTMHPLEVMASPECGEPITGVMPMGGLLNVDCSGEPSLAGFVAVGDSFCHTDPAVAYGLSFALAHAEALGRAAATTSDAGELVERYRDEVTPEARERFALACETDDARARRWRGEPLDPARRDGCYPLFSFAAALAAATRDDRAPRRTIRRIGLLDESSTATPTCTRGSRRSSLRRCPSRRRRQYPRVTKLLARIGGVNRQRRMSERELLRGVLCAG